MELRELTRQERSAIRSLVTRWCVNYDREYGCLPLECDCFMLGKCWTGACCRYFRDAVLPLDPALEAVMSNPRQLRPCLICGRPIPKDGRCRYCSEICRRIALRNQKRKYMRKFRGRSVDN